MGKLLQDVGLEGGPTDAKVAALQQLLGRAPTKSDKRYMDIAHKILAGYLDKPVPVESAAA